jgi:hypothetical protein
MLYGFGISLVVGIKNRCEDMLERLSALSLSPHCRIGRY